MKKVLIVANLAGFASFLINDIDTLKAMGYQVDFAANGDVLPWEDTRQKLSARDVSFYQIDFDTKNPFSIQNIKAFLQLKTLMRKEEYHLIHCHTPITGLIVRVAAFKYRKNGTKVVYTTHGFPFTEKSNSKKDAVFKFIEKFASKLSDTIITINREDFDIAKSFKCKNVYYIHGVGVDTKRYSDVKINRDEYRKSLGVDSDKVMILSVGELSTRKNHETIVYAISKLSQPDKYVYVICGNGIDGGTGTFLKKLAEERNVNLILLGFRYDIPQITACSDIGAIPSLREGLGLSGVQSLAAGVPVVGSCVQGIKDYITNNETGYLCNPTDSNEFASAIERLTNLSMEEKEAFKQNCYRKAEEFDIKISSAEMIEIYKGLLM